MVTIAIINAVGIEATRQYPCFGWARHYFVFARRSNATCLESSATSSGVSLA